MPSTSDIRERFLNFFEAQGHRIVPSGSLVPGNDKTLLFTNAGMVQFKDVFTGEDVRDYTRATTSQRCVRAGGKHNDLDNVGYTARHHTFFEMLGNFSFGDYSKREAIGFAWQFLTHELKLPADKLWVTVFEEDDEAKAIWIDEIGVPADRVIRIGAKDNFWMMGDTGPCGPCSEIFYDHGAEVAGGPPGSPDEDGDRYIEIWNLVFMQFDRQANGDLAPLPRPCVDTGMGLERIAAVLQHVHSNYEIDLFVRLIEASALGIESARGTADGAATAHVDRHSASLRVVADHIRSCAFLIVDGVLPGNEGRGYVLRRIIRRAVRHGHKLGAVEPFFHRLVGALVDEMGVAFPELANARETVETQLRLEEERFAATLAAGLRIFEEEVASMVGSEVPGETAFRLYDTYGFPVDLTADIARERGLTVDEAGFETHMQAQRDRARAAGGFSQTGIDNLHSDAETLFRGYSEAEVEARVLEIYVDGQAVESLAAGIDAWVVLDQTPFYAESGGQVGDTGSLVAESTNFIVDDTRKQRLAILHHGRLQAGTLAVGTAVTAQIDEIRRQRIRQHHSATHLLHGALREVLGPHVEQRGSLVSDAGLRFDFSHTGPVDADQLAAVERWVDREIRANSACVTREMPIADARAAGAMALFGEKYGDRVRVVQLGEHSIELCGGTHLTATGELGSFSVVQESGVAAGIRRIEALGGEASLRRAQWTNGQLDAVARLLRTTAEEAPGKLEQLQARVRELGRNVEQLQAKLSSQAGQGMLQSVETIGAVKLLLDRVEDTDAKGLRVMMDSLRQQMGAGVIVLASEHGGKAFLLASVSADLHRQFTAGSLMKRVADAMGGRGGGRDDLAQGGAPSLDNLEAGFAAARELLAG